MTMRTIAATGVPARMIAATAMLLAALSPAQTQKADPVADFYRGKTVRLIV
jgi:hypothetical protein